MEDSGAVGVEEALQGEEEAEEGGEVAEEDLEEDLEEGKKFWLSHTDMKVFISLVCNYCRLDYMLFLFVYFCFF